MTSTNDEKEVENSQTASPKGRSYYIKVYKSLDEGLTADGSLRDRTEAVCNLWSQVHSLCTHSAPSTHPHLLQWVQRHTASTILKSEWRDPSSKDLHNHLKQYLEAFIAEAHYASADRNDWYPWEALLIPRAEWFIKVIPDPWGHAVLRQLLDPGDGPNCDNQDVIQWLKEETGVVFVCRLRQLAVSKQCTDLALSLATAVMERKRGANDKEKINDSGGTLSFEDELSQNAGFTTEVWETLGDIEFVLLHKLGKTSNCIQLAKVTPLATSYKLIERLRTRLETSPTEKKLWKNAKNVALLIAEVVVTRCMVCEWGVSVGEWLWWGARAVSRLVSAPALPATAAALAAPALSSHHLHVFARAMETSSEDAFVVELYVRAITAGMNELEKLKLNNEKEVESRVHSRTLCTWFQQLSSVVKKSPRLAAECMLTAFSVFASPQLYETLKAQPVFPPPLKPQQAKETPSSSFGSWANDSRSHTNFVKTSETLNLEFLTGQTSVLSTAILNEGANIGLSPELCQDLAVLLSGPRVKTLTWDMDRDKLLEHCRVYMERTKCGTRSLKTELRYLNLDPKQYLHLPEEEDEDEDDIYYGIEKGYEHLVEVPPPSPKTEEIWTGFRPPSSESDYEIMPTKNRTVISSDDDEEDPLSLDVIAARCKKSRKKEKDQRKEHSKSVDNKTAKKEKKVKKKQDKKPSLGKSDTQKQIKGKTTKSNVTDSDYDSQGISSLASLTPENENNVEFDGLFSMDDLNITSPKEIPQISNTQVEKTIVKKPQKPRVIKKREPKPKDPAKELKQGTIPKAPKLKHCPENEKVRNTINKLLLFRKQSNTRKTNPVPVESKADQDAGLIDEKIIQSFEKQMSKDLSLPVKMGSSPAQISPSIAQNMAQNSPVIKHSSQPVHTVKKHTQPNVQTNIVSLSKGESVAEYIKQLQNAALEKRMSWDQRGSQETSVKSPQSLPKSSPISPILQSQHSIVKSRLPSVKSQQLSAKSRRIESNWKSQQPIVQSSQQTIVQSQHRLGQSQQAIVQPCQQLAQPIQPMVPSQQRIVQSQQVPQLVVNTQPTFNPRIDTLHKQQQLLNKFEQQHTALHQQIDVPPLVAIKSQLPVKPAPKVESVLNTFSRLSYMHKNKQAEPKKVEQQSLQAFSDELERRISAYKIHKHNMQRNNAQPSSQQPSIDSHKLTPEAKEIKDRNDLGLRTMLLSPTRTTKALPTPKPTVAQQSTNQTSPLVIQQLSKHLSAKAATQSVHSNLRLDKTELTQIDKKGPNQAYRNTNENQTQVVNKNKQNLPNKSGNSQLNKEYYAKLLSNNFFDKLSNSGKEKDVVTANQPCTKARPPTATKTKKTSAKYVPTKIGTLEKQSNDTLKTEPLKILSDELVTDIVKNFKRKEKNSSATLQASSSVIQDLMTQNHTKPVVTATNPKQIIISANKACVNFTNPAVNEIKKTKKPSKNKANASKLEQTTPKASSKDFSNSYMAYLHKNDAFSKQSSQLAQNKNVYTNKNIDDLVEPTYPTTKDENQVAESNWTSVLDALRATKTRKDNETEMKLQALSEITTIRKPTSNATKPTTNVTKQTTYNIQHPKYINKNQPKILNKYLDSTYQGTTSNVHICAQKDKEDEYALIDELIDEDLLQEINSSDVEKPASAAKLYQAPKSSAPRSSNNTHMTPFTSPSNTGCSAQQYGQIALTEQTKSNILLATVPITQKVVIVTPNIVTQNRVNNTYPTITPDTYISNLINSYLVNNTQNVVYKQQFAPVLNLNSYVRNVVCQAPQVTNYVEPTISTVTNFPVASSNSSTNAINITENQSVIVPTIESTNQQPDKDETFKNDIRTPAEPDVMRNSNLVERTPITSVKSNSHDCDLHKTPDAPPISKDNLTEKLSAKTETISTLIESKRSDSHSDIDNTLRDHVNFKPTNDKQENTTQVDMKEAVKIAMDGVKREEQLKIKRNKLLTRQIHHFSTAKAIVLGYQSIAKDLAIEDQEKEKSKMQLKNKDKVKPEQPVECRRILLRSSNSFNRDKNISREEPKDHKTSKVEVKAQKRKSKPLSKDSVAESTLNKLCTTPKPEVTSKETDLVKKTLTNDLHKNEPIVDAEPTKNENEGISLLLECTEEPFEPISYKKPPSTKSLTSTPKLISPRTNEQIEQAEKEKKKKKNQVESDKDKIVPSDKNTSKLHKKDTTERPISTPKLISPRSKEQIEETEREKIHVGDKNKIVPSGKRTSKMPKKDTTEGPIQSDFSQNTNTITISSSANQEMKCTPVTTKGKTSHSQTSHNNDKSKIQKTSVIGSADYQDFDFNDVTIVGEELIISNNRHRTEKVLVLRSPTGKEKRMRVSGDNYDTDTILSDPALQAYIYKCFKADQQFQLDIKAGKEGVKNINAKTVETITLLSDDEEQPSEKLDERHDKPSSPSEKRKGKNIISDTKTNLQCQSKEIKQTTSENDTTKTHETVKTGSSLSAKKKNAITTKNVSKSVMRDKVALNSDTDAKIVQTSEDEKLKKSCTFQAPNVKCHDLYGDLQPKENKNDVPILSDSSVLRDSVTPDLDDTALKKIDESSKVEKNKETQKEFDTLNGLDINEILENQVKLLELQSSTTQKSQAAKEDKPTCATKSNTKRPIKDKTTASAAKIHKADNSKLETITTPQIQKKTPSISKEVKEDVKTSFKIKSEAKDVKPKVKSMLNEQQLHGETVIDKKPFSLDHTFAMPQVTPKIAFISTDIPEPTLQVKSEFKSNNVKNIDQSIEVIDLVDSSDDESAKEKNNAMYNPKKDIIKDITPLIVPTYEINDLKNKLLEEIVTVKKLSVNKHTTTKDQSDPKLSSKCFVRLTRCDELVQKYASVRKRCFISLTKCDAIVDLSEETPTNSKNCDNLRSKSPSIINLNEGPKSPTILESNEGQKSPTILDSKEGPKSPPIVDSQEGPKSPMISDLNEDPKSPTILVDLNKDPKSPTILVDLNKDLKSPTILDSKEGLKSPTILDFKEGLKSPTILGSKEGLKSPTILDSQEGPKSPTILESNEGQKSPTILDSKEGPKSPPILDSQEGPKSPMISDLNEDPKSPTILVDLNKDLKSPTILVDLNKDLKSPTILGSKEGPKSPTILGSKEGLKSPTILDSQEGPKSPTIPDLNEGLKWPTILESNEGPKSPPILDSQEGPKSPTISDLNESPKSPTILGSKEGLKSPTILDSKEGPKSPTIPDLNEGLKWPTILESNEAQKSHTILDSKEGPKSPPILDSQEGPKSPTISDLNESPKSPTILGSKEGLKSPTILDSKEGPKSPTISDLNEGPKSPTILESNEGQKSPTILDSKEGPKSPPILDSQEGPKSPMISDLNEDPKSPTILVDLNKDPKSPTILVDLNKDLKSPTILDSKEGLKSPTILDFKEGLKSPTILGSKEGLKSPTILDSQEGPKSPTILESNEGQKSPTILDSKEGPKSPPILDSQEGPKSPMISDLNEDPKSPTILVDLNKDPKSPTILVDLNKDLKSPTILGSKEGPKSPTMSDLNEGPKSLTTQVSELLLENVYPICLENVLPTVERCLKRKSESLNAKDVKKTDIICVDDSPKRLKSDVELKIKVVVPKCTVNNEDRPVELVTNTESISPLDEIHSKTGAVNASDDIVKSNQMVCLHSTASNNIEDFLQTVEAIAPKIPLEDQPVKCSIEENFAAVSEIEKTTTLTSALSKDDNNIEIVVDVDVEKIDLVETSHDIDKSHKEEQCPTKDVAYDPKYQSENAKTDKNENDFMVCEDSKTISETDATESTIAQVKINMSDKKDPLIEENPVAHECNERLGVNSKEKINLLEKKTNERDENEILSKSQGDDQIKTTQVISSEGETKDNIISGKATCIVLDKLVIETKQSGIIEGITPITEHSNELLSPVIEVDPCVEILKSNSEIQTHHPKKDLEIEPKTDEKSEITKSSEVTDLPVLISSESNKTEIENEIKDSVIADQSTSSDLNILPIDANQSETTDRITPLTKHTNDSLSASIELAPCVEIIKPGRKDSFETENNHPNKEHEIIQTDEKSVIIEIENEIGDNIGVSEELLECEDHNKEEASGVNLGNSAEQITRAEKPSIKIGSSDAHSCEETTTTKNDVTSPKDASQNMPVADVGTGDVSTVSICADEILNIVPDLPKRHDFFTNIFDENLDDFDNMPSMHEEIPADEFLSQSSVVSSMSDSESTTVALSHASSDSNIAKEYVVDINEAEKLSSGCLTPAIDELPGFVMPGIEVIDPDIGKCYIFRPICSSGNTTPSSELSSYDDKPTKSDDVDVTTSINDEEVSEVSQIIDYENENFDNTINKPTKTYPSKCINIRKRRHSGKDVQTSTKKYRKGKNIDYPKMTAAAMNKYTYKKDYNRVIAYVENVEFSFASCFLKEYFDVQKLQDNWPENCTRNNKPIEKSTEDSVFIFEEESPTNNKILDPFIDTTLDEEINSRSLDTQIPSTEELDNNFSMGFGERSGRVIQNLNEKDNFTISAATLSDVKQYQPSQCENLTDINIRIINVQKKLTYQMMLRKVKHFFDNYKVTCSANSRSVFERIQELCKTTYMQPVLRPLTVNVVQVGQLPVSAAAQNPVTCDPRVTHVSDASPSQCSVESSPQSQENHQTNIKAEYTELTTADLSLPLQNMSNPNEESNEVENKTNITEQNVIPTHIETESKTSSTNDCNAQTTNNNPSSDVSANSLEYQCETNGNNAKTSPVNPIADSTQNIYNTSTSFKESENQRRSDNSTEKTDQIAHAMNAAGITTSEIPMTTRSPSFMNLISQKVIRPPPNTIQANNNYPKTTAINAISLQQALAQILPPPLNQTNNGDGNPQQNVTPQVLHIVHGKNTSGNQITLLDNSQQSVLSGSNPTQVLHIVQNKGPVTSQNNVNPQPTTFSGLSLVDAGLQQGGNQLLHIVNTGAQKTNNAGQLLKRVNLLTNLTNMQGGNEQKMVQFVCKSADGKSIHLNAPHQRSMVLRLQPIETPVQPPSSKANEQPDTKPGTTNTQKTTKDDLEVKSRSVYEENYAKFIQSASATPPTPGTCEKSTSLPKFNQAFGKPVFQDEAQKQDDLNVPSVQNTENSECRSAENPINIDHISQIGSPPLLLRKQPVATSQAQQNIVQQIKQTIAPMNIQTMHGGVIYTRQIPVNLGGGQTINLITVPSTEMVDESGHKQPSEVKFITQNEGEPSIIKIVPQTAAPNAEGNQENGNAHIVTSEGSSQPQPVLTQMRIKLPMLSKAPQVVPGTRVVRPSFFQIQRNVIGGANQQVYQQLVLTAAPTLGQQTIRLPQAQTRIIKGPTETQTSESQLSSSTLEQLREFDMVLEQVKERSTVQPGASPSYSKSHSTDTTDGASSSSSTHSEQPQQILYSIGPNQTMNVAYINKKATVTTSTANFVRSPDSSIADSPSTPVSQVSHDPQSSNESQSKTTRVGSKSVKSRPSRPATHTPTTVKLNHTIPPKTSQQKPLEDEQTTQRILYILAEYKEQVENSPDKDKPAPRRRTNLPTNPSGSSKRKKSGSRRSGCTRDHSPITGDDASRTMGSEDSSCGTSQGDCTESLSMEAHSPQESPRKVVRKLFEPESLNATQTRPQPQRNVIVADGQTITVARSATGKPTTAVLMPANYILPVSMVKGGQQIAIVTNRGPKLLTVGGTGESGAANALFLQRLIGPGGLKPVLARPGVRHVRLPTAALHNLQAFNLATSAPQQQADSTASPSLAPTPDLETRANSSPWTDTDAQSDVKMERGSSPESSEPWNLPSSSDRQDYSYEDSGNAKQTTHRTVLDSIPDRYSPDAESQRIFDKMFEVDKKYIVEGHDDLDASHSDCDDKVYNQVVHNKDGSSRSLHRVAQISAAALRHKYAILEQELRLQKSLSEECEDLGVDSPSASELFPEAELLFAASPADHDGAHHSHPAPPPTHQPPELAPQLVGGAHSLRDVGLDLDDDGVVTVNEDGLQAMALDQEEFARAHPNTTFHTEPNDLGVQPFALSSSVKSRHVTTGVYGGPPTVLMTPATVLDSHTRSNPTTHYDIDNIAITTHNSRELNLSSVLVKDDRLTRFENILTDSRELHLSNTASAIVHPGSNATQVIRRVCYDDDKSHRYLMDDSEIIAGDDAKMAVVEDDSRDATLGSIGEVDDNASSPERHAELFWESNSASVESRRPLDFSSDSDKCCKSPSLDETNSTDSSGVGTQMRLDSVIKEARARERSASACSSVDETTHPPIRTYPPKRSFHTEEERSLSGKTRAGESSPDNPEVRRRASSRGVVKRGCHCCNGSPAPQRPKKQRQRKPTLDFTTNN